MPPIFHPNYIKTLSGDDLKRYELKVRLCGEDPYESRVEWTVSAVPDVTREDVVQYLVLKTDFYTLEQLKNHKSLEAHNFLTSGRMKGCATKAVKTNEVIAFGKVTHSQALNDSPLKCWILLRINGAVLAGHCTCMAGTGEVCSHVGATLFYLELIAGKKRATTCTSELNRWLQPAHSSAPMRPIVECDLRSAGRKWRELQNGDTEARKPAKRHCQATTSYEDVDDLLSKLKSKGVDSAILRVWDGLQKVQDTVNSPSILPSPLSSMFDEKYSQLPFEELKTHCDRVFCTINITKEESVNLERSTRGQHTNPIWTEHRAGRITASRMKNVCRTNVDNPSVSLIKAICYPGANKFSSEHTRRGIKEEPKILEEFGNIAGQQHQNFKIVTCGLVVNPRYPFLGASPDALTSCTCHGCAVVEVKSISVDTKENTGLLNGILDRTHKFSFQIQTQMLVCELSIGFFVEQKPNGDIHIQLIEPDLEIQAEILAKTAPFFKGAILPELICKYFSSERHILAPLDNSRGSRANIPICICKEPPCAPMINCIGANCPIITYHKKCVGISRNLKKWTCPNCQQKV